jgi:signal peptidase I
MISRRCSGRLASGLSADRLVDEPERECRPAGRLSISRMDTTPAPTPTPERRSLPRRVLRELLFFGALVAALLSARSSLADHYQVPTGSMIPTVEIGDRIVVNKAAYGVRVPFSDTWAFELAGPERGDVVVLRSPEDGEVLLKRVVGIPGDRVVVRDGRIVLGGERLDVFETATGELRELLGAAWHSVRLDHGGGRDYGPVEIPAGQYLVMGDNRGLSHDGREFGLIDRGAIQGRAIAVYWRGGLVWRGL